MGQGKDLAELELASLQACSPAIETDVFEILSPEGSVGSRNVLGGTAPEQVKSQIAAARKRLSS